MASAAGTRDATGIGGCANLKAVTAAAAAADLATVENLAEVDTDAEKEDAFANTRTASKKTLKDTLSAGHHFALRLPSCLIERCLLVLLLLLLLPPCLLHCRQFYEERRNDDWIVFDLTA
eukprot:scaffold14725_cov144-Skeletonema_dohrnii-CCMP3373.AAC.4